MPTLTTTLTGEEGVLIPATEGKSIQVLGVQVSGGDGTAGISFGFKDGVGGTVLWNLVSDATVRMSVGVLAGREPLVQCTKSTDLVAYSTSDAPSSFTVQYVTV